MSVAGKEQKLHDIEDRGLRWLDGLSWDETPSNKVSHWSTTGTLGFLLHFCGGVSFKYDLGVLTLYSFQFPLPILLYILLKVLETNNCILM